MNALITGADGFVGAWLARRFLADGHSVTGTFRRDEDHRATRFSPAERDAIAWVEMELGDDASVSRSVGGAWDVVVHLAAVSWIPVAERSPGRAWNDNAGGTARLLRALADAKRAGEADPRVLVVSSIEVYGAGGTTARRESDPVAPVSTYAASKVGGEVAALQEWRRTGIQVVIARPSPHSGPGQGERGLVPKYARRIVTARRVRAPAIPTGLLDGVRDFLHVADVVDAYVRLLSAGVPGEVYNVSSGEPVRLEDLIRRLCELARWTPILEVDSAEVRPDSVPHLVGDPGKLEALTGWRPTRSLDQLLQDVLDAQTD